MYSFRKSLELELRRGSPYPEYTPIERGELAREVRRMKRHSCDWFCTGEIRDEQSQDKCEPETWTVSIIRETTTLDMR